MPIAPVPHAIIMALAKNSLEPDNQTSSFVHSGRLPDHLVDPFGY